MRFEQFSFDLIRIDGVTCEHDVVVDRGEVRKRKKKHSKKFREAFGHTPLSVGENIPWKCRRLVVGTGAGALPVMEEVTREFSVNSPGVQTLNALFGVAYDRGAQAPRSKPYS
jgi:hypothetical protein